jgi:hypothetical protein
MMRRAALIAAAGAAAGAPAVWAQAAETPAPRPIGALKPLGDDRYQVGRIVVDKRSGSFAVPGRVLVLGKPLEYIATSPAGMKDYESMLELDATGSEFNLACILIGLERGPQSVPAMRYRAVPRLVGPRVNLLLRWDEGGKKKLLPAAEALLNPEAGVEPGSVEWVYTGSPTSEGQGRFSADETGTLIGVVHDANTIIEAAVPIGLGAYGSVRGSAAAPPVGTPVELVVQAVKPPK